MYSILGDYFSFKKNHTYKYVFEYSIKNIQFIIKIVNFGECYYFDFF